MYIPELIIKAGRRRGLRNQTIKTYRECLKLFFKKCNKDPKEITKRDVNDFLDNLLDKGACGNTINVYLSALKFLFSQILNKRLMTNIKYSKTPKRLAEYLTKDETIKFLSVIKNPKHKLIACVLYSTGVRVGEFVKLKPKDLDFENDFGWVRDGKGGKDRLFILAKKINPVLKDFIKENLIESNNYIFKGQKRGHISVRTVQMIVKKAKEKARIIKNISPHSMRHSFSTHVLLQGDDVVSLQSLLGHASVNTTMTYIHMLRPNMINVKSPFDSL